MRIANVARCCYRTLSSNDSGSVGALSPYPLGQSSENCRTNRCVEQPDLFIGLSESLAREHYGKDLWLVRKQIQSTLRRYRNSFFAPELVDAFLDISFKEAFWLKLEPNHIKASTEAWMPQPALMELEGADVRQLAKIFATIVDAKSPFTAEHSTGVAHLSRWLAESIHLSQLTCDQLEIAGMLHDIGKLMVPDEISDKPGELNASEMAVIRKHSFETYQILKSNSWI